MNRTTIEWTNWSVNALKLQLPNGALIAASPAAELFEPGIRNLQVGPLINACVHRSRGCEHCYAETLTRRWWKKEWGEFPGYVPALLKMGKPVLVEKELEAVLRLSQRIAAGKADPNENRIFWHDMTDEYLDFWPDELLDKIWAVRALTPNLIHQILTKRPERMYGYLTGQNYKARHYTTDLLRLDGASARRSDIRCEIVSLSGREGYERIEGLGWPLPNVHLGVSCENQQTADARIPWLLKTPAAVRWVSYEPALGPVDFNQYLYNRYHMGGAREMYAQLDWLVCGGESGPGARPFDIQWARDVIAQCKAAGVKVFCKQLGSLPVIHPFTDSWDIASPRFGEKIAEGTIVRLKDKKGGDPSEWPDDLKVREYPLGASQPKGE